MNRIILILAVIILCVNSQAQKHKTSFLFHEIFKNGNAPKKMRIQVYDQFLPSTELIDTTLASDSSDFIFQSGRISRNGVMMITYPGIIGSKMHRLYYIKTNDHINVVRHGHQTDFSGTNAARYECSDKIQQISYDSAYSSIKSKDISRFMTLALQALENAEKERISIIESFRPRLGNEWCSMLSLDNQSMKWQVFFYQLWGRLITSKDSMTRSAVARFYKDSVGSVSFSSNQHSSRVAACYPSALYEHSRFAQLIDNYLADYNKDKPKIRFDQLWKRIASMKDVIGSQRALLFLVTQSHLPGSDSSGYFLSSLYRQVKDPDLKKACAVLLPKYRQGTPVRQFEFLDVLGRRTSSHLMKGKIVLVDFWFTGCTGCVQIAPYLKKIIDSLKSRTDILILSVSADNNKEQWLKSVSAEIYGSAHELNLYAGPRGSDHPFFKFYGITGFPRLMVFDRNGNLYRATVNPPRDEVLANQILSLMLDARLKAAQGQ